MKLNIVHIGDIICSNILAKSYMFGMFIYGTNIKLNTKNVNVIATVNMYFNIYKILGILCFNISYIININDISATKILLCIVKYNILLLLIKLLVICVAIIPSITLHKIIVFKISLVNLIIIT